MPNMTTPVSTERPKKKGFLKAPFSVNFWLQKLSPSCLQTCPLYNSRRSPLFRYNHQNQQFLCKLPFQPSHRSFQLSHPSFQHRSPRTPLLQHLRLRPKSFAWLRSWTCRRTKSSAPTVRRKRARCVDSTAVPCAIVSGTSRRAPAGRQQMAMQRMRCETYKGAVPACSPRRLEAGSAKRHMLRDYSTTTPDVLRIKVTGI